MQCKPDIHLLLRPIFPIFDALHVTPIKLSSLQLLTEILILIIFGKPLNAEAKCSHGRSGIRKNVEINLYYEKIVTYIVRKSKV